MDFIDYKYNEDVMGRCDCSSWHSLVIPAGHGQNYVLGRLLWISVEMWRMGWMGGWGKESQKQRHLLMAIFPTFSTGIQ